MTLYADAAGTRIAYDTVGSGPDLIFLHAGIADRTMWEPQLEAFSSRYRCIALDFRGFGDSAVGEESFSRRDDLAAVMDAVGVDRATVIGCSVGAGFALDFAIEQPTRVERLVLVGVYPSGFDQEDDPFLLDLWPQVEAAIERGDFEESGRLEARAWVDGPRREAGAAPKWLVDKVVEWCIAINQVTEWGDSVQLDPPAIGRLDEVIAPTLVVVGRDDAQVVIDACRVTALGIEGAQLIELDDTAHLPNLEVTAAFNATLEGFLG